MQNILHTTISWWSIQIIAGDLRKQFILINFFTLFTLNTKSTSISFWTLSMNAQKIKSNTAHYLTWPLSQRRCSSKTNIISSRNMKCSLPIFHVSLALVRSICARRIYIYCENLSFFDSNERISDNPFVNWVRCSHFKLHLVQSRNKSSPSSSSRLSSPPIVVSHSFI